MSQRAPIAVLVGALVTSGVLLLSFVSDLTFVGDSWELVAGRPDWTVGTLLEPFNEHPIVIPALIFKVLLTLFGMNSVLPFYAVSISLFLLCAVLVFVYMRRCVGDWLALAGALLLLFMGAAYEDLLWEFQMCFFGSIAAGIGSLLALERGDKFGDRAACALLVISNAFSTLGMPFVAAAFARVWLGPDRRRRAYVPVLPLALYAIWWLLSEHSAGSQIGLEDIPDLPLYIFDVASAGIASLLGQQPIEGNGQPPLLAQLLSLLLAAVLVYSIGKRRRVPPGLIVALVLVFSFWVLLALDRGPQRFSSRFQFPSAVFLLIVAAEALRGQRLVRWATVVVGLIAAAAVVGGISLLEQGYSHRKSTADKIRATLAAVDVAGADARPGYLISFPPSIYLSVEQFRVAKRKHGTPALSEAQLLSTGEIQRQIADRTLVAAMDLHLRPATGGRDFLLCQNPDPVDGVTRASLSPPGAFRLENRSNEKAVVRIRRFSENLSTYVGDVAAGATMSLHLPAGRSPRPWWLTLEGGPIRLCIS